MREIAIVFGAEFRRTIRSARVVVLLALYGLFTLLILLFFGWAAAKAKERLGQGGGDAGTASEMYRKMQDSVVETLYKDDQAMIDMLKRVPILVLYVFKIALFWLPLYIGLIGFDQISGELGPRSVRFLAIRARRSSILIGKFLGQWGILIALVVAVNLAVFIFAKATNPDFSTGIAILTFLRFCLAAALFSLAYMALSALCSTLTRQSAVSLAFYVIALFVFWAVNAIGSLYAAAASAASATADAAAPAAASPIAYIRFIAPSHYGDDLLHPTFSRFGVAGLAFLGFTLVFLGTAYGVLRARDL